MNNQLVSSSYSSSSSSSSCCIDITPSWRYDVFLSFRGEDTRTNFTDHLYKALFDKGIHTFIEGQLVRGEEISPVLFQAIEESRISLVIFSKTYAASRWCLDELVKILQCRQSKQQIVLPVFYKVDPSHVRNQTSRFGDEFNNLQCKFKDNEEKILAWRSALREAANLSGYCVKEGEYEATFISKIVEDIFDKVFDGTYLDVAKYPVGIQSCVQEVKDLLGVDGNGHRVVGIWGTSGIGKTTIAKAVYNAIAHKFQVSCFLADVRESSTSLDGLIQLQKTFLSKILRGTKLEIVNVHEGISLIKKLLRQKKILLILDDVDESEQLKNWVDVDCFGEGSRVIITTKDRSLLDFYGGQWIYEVQKLEDDKALELFSWNAFQRNRPPDDCLNLARRAIACAQGLPLALNILGSYLRNKDINRWQAILDGCDSYESESCRGIRDAANLSGHSVKEGEDDAESIMEIVANMIKVLRQSTAVGIHSRVHAVGIHSRVQEISNYLDVGGSDDVRIIGIWGMGGLGKTTVANAIFNKYQDTFEGKSFLANVREEKLVDLQNTLISDVVRSGIIKVHRVDEGTEDIKRRLSNLRVLVIVDDVDSVKQLEALAIKFYSFGPGSRIIITTRDQHLLKILKVNRIYHLPAMNKEEALELLSWHTFDKCYPNKEYLQVSREVVDYCGGLPLALKALGSNLSGRSISKCTSELEKLKSHPNEEILNRLKISYDGLADDDLKAIFLDISCFFTGMNKDYVMKILDGCDLYPEIRISVLQERCLVTTNDDFTLVMHDLLRDMGRYIVHVESPDDPGKRSRLWHHDDVIDVLKNESGTEAVQGLTLDLQESDEISFSTEAFRNMHSLRLLKLNYVKLTGSYNNLPNELRWLCWHGFPLEVIPEDFDHPNIVVIDLSYSKLTRVWEDSDLLLEKLKFLNLSHSHNLTRSPDFSKTPNLERLILKDCKNLQAIPALPTNLEILEADECIALEKMPDFSEMSRMRELHLNHSPKLSEILGLDKALNSMTSIHMEGCTNLTASIKEAILQGWSTSGNGGLFLPGNEIPSWFTPVDPQGEIAVPQSFGCDLKALTVCIIYSSDDSESGGSLRIRVANYSQNTVFLISPMRATVLTSHENYLWLGHLSNNKLNVKGGDKINVGAHFVGPGTTDDIHFRVKKIGINLEKAGHGDDSSHENQSRKRLRLDPSVERNAEEETDEIMQGSSMG